MANNRMTEGVGKKIVEALKMQSDIEITTSNENFETENYSEEIVEEPEILTEEIAPEIEENVFVEEPEITETNTVEETIPTEEPTLKDNLSFENYQEDLSPFEKFASLEDARIPQPQVYAQEDISEFEIPSNVAVLKQLINKLPAGVTKQTGALIIKQTMEALGISMRSVLQEAQQVQENLNSSARECLASIAEYKKQIGVLEKQAQKYQRQYAALNDVISVFVQTSI